MKILYTGGDSHTVGEELEYDPEVSIELKDNPDISLFEIRNKYSFGGILANKLGYTHINKSATGGSNHRIVRTTIDFIQSLSKEDYEDLLIIIGWTSAERNELYLKNDKGHSWGRSCLSNHATGNIYFAEDHDVFKYRDFQQSPYLREYFKIYTRSLYSRTAILTEYITQILLLSNLFENLGIKYYFFEALSGFWDTEKKCLPEDLVNSRNKVLTQNMHFGKSMVSFLTEKGVPIATNGHFFKEGHKLWAEEIYSNLKNLYPELYR